MTKTGETGASRRQLLQGIGALPLLGPLRAQARGSAHVSVSAAARASGRIYGTAAGADLGSNAGLASAILQDCTSITPEYQLKWDAVERVEGELRFGAVDELARFAEQHAMELRGHTLLWERSTPAWARRKIRQQDWAPVRRWFEAAITRYPQVRDWEVVNEPIDTERGRDGYRTTGYYRAFGPDYVRRALADARALAPAARLMINEFGLEYDHPVDAARRGTLLRMVEPLRREGLIDAVGVQSHLDLAKGSIEPHVVRGFFQNLADLGLQIVVTELDVREADRRAPVAERDARVASEVERFLEGALSVQAVTGVSTWGLTDRHSWLTGASRGSQPLDQTALNRGLPLDSDLQPKPFYWTLRDAFAQRAG